MIAVKRLQSLFWVLLVALGALGAYLVSLRVATERNDLMHVRAQIAQTRGDIRYLETEFAARANMRQLEAWNAEDFRYSALPADQYLDSERDLARLDGVQPNGPAYVAQPVMVAMKNSDGHAAMGSDAGVDVMLAPSPAVLQIRSDAATIRATGAVDRPVAVVAGRTLLAALPGEGAPAKKAQTAKSDAAARKSERMAMLDSRLLDDHTLGEISRKAAAEIVKGAR